MKIRIFGFLILAAGLAGLLLPAFAEVALDRRVKSLMLEVQTALQNFHVKEEIYPREPMDGAELIDLLKSTGHLKSVPQNPWTKADYQLPDEAVDFLKYETDELAETYTLIARRRNGEVHFVLDSTENHSLEE